MGYAEKFRVPPGKKMDLDSFDVDFKPDGLHRTEAEEKFRELVRQSPFSIQIVDAGGHIEEVNQAFKDLWGIPEEDLPEVLAKYNMLEDEEARRRGVMPLIEKAFNGEAVVLPVIEYDAAATTHALGVDTKANKVWIRARLYPVKNEKGKPVREIQTTPEKPEPKPEPGPEAQAKPRPQPEQKPEGRLLPWDD